LGAHRRGRTREPRNRPQPKCLKQLSLLKILSLFNFKQLCKMDIFRFVTEYLWQRGLYARFSCYDLAH
jgi:hypothetical protein